MRIVRFLPAVLAAVTDVVTGVMVWTNQPDWVGVFLSGASVGLFYVPTVLAAGCVMVRDDRRPASSSPSQ